MRMVASLIFVFSCLLSWIPGGVSVEVVTTRLGGVARFNCSAPTGGSVEWKRKLPKEFSYIYVHPWLHKPYDTGGRHNVSWDPVTGACDLVIKNVTEGDAGKYYCTETIGRRETHFELVVLLVAAPTCLTNISLTNVLVDNDCDIDPDYIEFNCSIAYHGNVAPDMQLQMSNIGVLDNVTVQTWQQSTTTYMSVVWTSKASWQMRDGRFRCEVRNAMVDTPATCFSARVSAIYFYKSNRSLEISPSKDYQAHHFVTCAANTSEQCSYSWQGTHSDSSKSSDVLGPTIDLKSVDVEISSMRCHAECRIRNNVCVSKPMFIKFLPDEGDHPFSKINIPAIIVPIVVVVLLAVGFIVVLLWKFKRKNNGKQKSPEATEEEMQRLTESVQNAIDPTIQQSRPTPCIEDQDDEMNLDNPTLTDIAKYIKGFENVRSKLKDYIDPFNQLPFCFVDNDIISNEEAERIETTVERIQTTVEIVSKMNQYVKKDKKNCISILKALKENDQTHIAKFIVSSGMNNRSPHRVLKKEETKAIDQNMFCLEKLVRHHVLLFASSLVELECITDNHKQWIINWEKRKEGAYILFEIIKRRSFSHFTVFVNFLQEIGKTEIVDVLTKGGVVEVTNYLIGITDPSERETIEKRIISQFCGYKDNKPENKLNEEHESFIDEFCKRLNQKKDKIKFICCYPTNSIAMYFQCETKDSKKWLVDFCKNGELKKELNTLFRLLQPDLNSYPNFDVNVSKTNSSEIHSFDTAIHYKSECRLDSDVGPSKDREQNSDETKLEIMEEIKRASHSRTKREGKLEHTLAIKRLTKNKISSVNAKVFEAGSNEVDGGLSMIQCHSDRAELETEKRKLKQQCCNQLTTKCYQLKIHRTKDDAIETIVKNFYEGRTKSVLERMNLIEYRGRTLDFWKIFPSVNPRPLVKFDRDELFKQDSTALEPQEDMIFRWSIVLCHVFENLMRTLGWNAGDTLDIEEDICDVVGQLLMKVEKQDRSSLLDCMQSAMMNIQVENSKQDGDKLRTLLITKKKYNGLNLACILLEQLIIDNKNSNVSWMRIICGQFIDLVVQLIIEPDYREDVYWTLTYLLKWESKWDVADVYNLVKNGLLMFHEKHKRLFKFFVSRDNQKKFHRYLMIIRNFALYPSLNIRPTEKKKPVELKDILCSQDKNKWRCINKVVREEEIEKSVTQVLYELKEELTEQTEGQIGPVDRENIQTIITNSQIIIKKCKGFRKYQFKHELDKICNSDKKSGIDVLSSCLAVTSMALHTCKKYWPLNAQLVSYCLLVAQRTNEKGRLLEILTGEGKSCVIAMVAATHALLGRTVDIVTSSPVLSTRDAEAWLEFYKTMDLDAGCNVEDNMKEAGPCYTCPIVYGTVETFARDILRTEYLLRDVRECRKCDIVIVDEVDSMLIDQGVQCTYLSHDVASMGMRHFEPILSLIWMHTNKFLEFHDNGDMIWYRTEQELFFYTLCRISKDPLQILRKVENEHGFLLGFTDKYLKKNTEDQLQWLRSLSDSDVNRFFLLAQEYLNADIKIYAARDFRKSRVHTGISILVYKNGLSSVVLPGDMVKNHLEKMITGVLSDKIETGINLPNHLRDHCVRRLRFWIDNAFVAQEMRQDREYVVRDNAVYPVDFQSTGVIEKNKKWGDGLQQFLEMKHDLPLSPLSLITNFLSNVDFFCQHKGKNYAYNIILGVSGTLGGIWEKTFMRETFSVDFATIPTFKRRKLFELDGRIFEDKLKWLGAMVITVESVVANQRAVLVICEDIATADKIKEKLSRDVSEKQCYLHHKGDQQQLLEPGDMVITTNLGARGTHFAINPIVNENGGLFVLVTFIPSNDRVEKQAFGRSGRRGETGSCQIMVCRKEMPKWLRLCETVHEAKRLRNAVDEKRLNLTNEMKMMGSKQELFRNYCGLKKKFSYRESEYVKIQVDILDEKWAMWIQEWETRSLKSHNVNDLSHNLENDSSLPKELEILDETQDVKTRAQEFHHMDFMELDRYIEDWSNRARMFESDNIYHLLKFGAVRLIKGDFEGASKFYDQVIRMDPVWSAFAHYNRAYCTLHIKGNNNIQRAIEDLNNARCKFKIYEWASLFSEIHGYGSVLQKRLREFDQSAEETKSLQSKYHIMMECQLLQHIDTQITETIEKLRTIDITGGEVKIIQRDILDSIPGSDFKTETMLHRYLQLGLIFTYNIDDEPAFCFSSQIVFSREVLRSVAATILMAFLSGILLKCDLPELKDLIDDVCNIGINSHDALLWMSQSVTSAIITEYHSNSFIRDVSSLLSIEQTNPGASFKMETETSQLTQFSNSQATSMMDSLATMTREIIKFASSEEDEISWHTNNAVLNILRKKIDQEIQRAHGKKLHGPLCRLINSVGSQSRSDLQQLVDFILRHLSDAAVQTNEFQNIIIDLRSEYKEGVLSMTTLSSVSSEITTTAADNYIRKITAIFLKLLLDKISELTHTMNGCVRYCVDKDKKLEDTHTTLTSLLGDVIEATVESNIIRSIMFDSQKQIKHVFSSIHRTLSSCYESSVDNFPQSKPKSMEELLRRFKEFHKDPNKNLIMRLMAEVKVVSEYCECKIVISDVDKAIIIRISSPEYRNTRELVYSPPSPAYPAGHFQSCVDGRVVRFKRQKKKESDDVDVDYHLFHAASFLLNNTFNDSIIYYIDEHPHRYGELFTSEYCACQLKMGCAILRLDMNHPTRQLNRYENDIVERDTSHRSSCIEQALKSANVSPLAEVLAEYESESRSAETNSSDHETELMTSSVSRDACNIFLSSGSSDEVKIYRQLIVEKINDGDITTALKLCCIGHQIPICRGNSNLPISDAQTLRDTFDQMLKTESYEQEKSKYLSIIDEWHKVLEPRGLMSIEQSELLREWISTRQYANTEDPVVSLVIEKCSVLKNEEEGRRWSEAKKLRKEEVEEEETDKEGSRSNLAKLRSEINKWKEQYYNELTTKCYQLKIDRTMDDDYEKVIRNFHESKIVQPVLDRIELMEDQWRKLDLWEILQSVNPRPLVKIGTGELFEQDSTLLQNKEDMTFRWSIVLCRIFENLMQTLGWKVGDTLDIEEDICDVVGQLLMKVGNLDRSSLLYCMQSAMMNIQVEDSKQEGDKLRTLLIMKKKYNGLNLACIHIEQMIIDNKDNNVSWMRVVCAQFIDLVVQLIIEPDYREDVYQTLNYLLKLESEWNVADVYNLMKNGLLMFHDNQKIFHRYLIIIRNFALYPSLNIRPTKKKKPVEWKDILCGNDENEWICLNDVVCGEETDKSVDQVLRELKDFEIGQAEKDTIQQIITISDTMLNTYNDVREYPIIIERELDRIRIAEQKYGVDVLSSCLAVTSMALYSCKKYWPLNTQLVSYCLLVAQRLNAKGRLLEILTGEGKSCVIAMVAATYALQGRTVDIVTSSPVLSQRDAEEWWEFYSLMKLEVGCNVEDNTKKDTTCYECPIVYGTVETFARDILKTEFLLQDVRKGRICDIVIVDEVDSMLIDQGVQCTYLSHDVPSVELCHFDPVLALIWMHVNSITPVSLKEGVVFHATEPEVLLVTLSRLRNDIDPLQILRLVEEDEEVRDIKKGFTDEYLSKDFEGQRRILSSVDSFDFFVFARKVMYLDIDIYKNIQDFISGSIQRTDRSRISIIAMKGGLASIVSHEDTIKNQLTRLITKCVLSDKDESKIDRPIYLKDYCVSRLRCWIDNAFFAKEMQPGREYIIDGDAIYPVDFKSTGVIETNKKWGDGLQQFLEMKHGLPRSPLSLITNFLSNIDFLERYGSNIVGVTGTLGDDHEKQFMRDTFSVKFATIPASKQRKLFVLDGIILEDKKAWLIIISEKVISAVASQRAVLVICEDIATADEIHKLILSRSETKPHLHTKGGDYDEGHENKKLKPGDVVITTNLGARGTDFSTDDVVNKNGGLFVLVTFIPLNDCVEKQAFGRTGRRGATGSCQIIVNRETMPEWLRQCRTVEEAKSVRDSIKMHRLNNMTELDMMRSKQQLFREYCEFKNRFVTSSASEPDDIEIQLELLDETWAKWIQDVETRSHELNQVDLIEELRRNIEVCSNRAKRFESDNIYSILKFGGVRLMKDDFERATLIYDQVIRMDPEWSAFAHYNRAYCTIQMKGDGYIRRAIDDLNATLSKLESYKNNCLFSEIHANVPTRQEYIRNEVDDDCALRVRDTSTQICTMMECQLFVHIDSQIIQTIEKLENIDTMEGEVTTVRQDILDSIPGANCRTEQMLQEYRQLGLLFIYNIDKKPKFCYSNQIVFSLVLLESVADIILMGVSKGTFVNDSSVDLRDTINAACSLKVTGNESFGWMSRCVSRAIITGIHSIYSMRDVSSLVPTKQTQLEILESDHKMRKQTLQFRQYANSQARYILDLLDSRTREMNNLVSSQEDEILLHTTNVAFNFLRQKIEKTIRDKIKPGHTLYRVFRCLYSSVTSPSDHQQYVDCIRDLARLSANSSLHSDDYMQTAELQIIALNLMLKSRKEGITAEDLVRSYTSEIENAAANIEIGTVMTNFSDLLCDKMRVFDQDTEANVCDDVQMLEATNKVLTSVWSEIIQGMIQYRITRLVMLDIQERTEKLFASIKYTLSVKSDDISKRKPYKPLPDVACHLKKYHNQMNKSRGSHIRHKTDAGIISKLVERNIIILDFDKEAILTISSPGIRESIELIYNPSCPAYPGGHFDAYVGGKVVKAPILNYEDYEDYDMLYSVIKMVAHNATRLEKTVEEFIDEHPSDAGMILIRDAYANQLKRGRALLRLDMNYPTRQLNQSEYVKPDSSHLSSCIEQALKSENVSQLAKVLAEYESESRSADVNASKHGTEVMTSSVSHDACKLFQLTGNSVEAEVYRQLVVERIHDGDATTALKLCCIGHQTPFGCDVINIDRPISDVQTIGDTIEQMLKMESYEEEISKFQSICDEWYRVLKPQGMMNIQRELLREWISTRQYANTEDLVVSFVIEKCSEPKKEEEERKWQEAKKMRKGKI